MELEEMKKMWKEYDTTLQKNKQTNEQLVKRILQHQSRSSLQKIISYEYLGVSLCAIVLLLMLGLVNRTGNNTALVGCCVISFLMIIISLCIGFIKISKLSRISFDNPVSETSNKLEQFRMLITKERIYTFIALPIMVFTLMAVGRKWMHNENVFDHLRFFAPLLLVAFIIAIIASIILYRNLYFNKIEEINKNLKEIESFRQNI